MRFQLPATFLFALSVSTALAAPAPPVDLKCFIPKLELNQPTYLTEIAFDLARKLACVDGINMMGPIVCPGMKGVDCKAAIEDGVDICATCLKTLTPQYLISCIRGSGPTCTTPLEKVRDDCYNKGRPIFPDL